MASKLKSLRELKAFDGDKYKEDMHRDEPLPKKCIHKDVTLINGSEMKCKCGVGWQGANVLVLYKALRDQ